MSFSGDLPAEGSGLDYSDIGAGQRSGAVQLPFMESLADTASHALFSGVRGVLDYTAMDAARQQAIRDQQFNVDPTQDPGGALIDPKEWQTKYPDLGLTFTPDMGQAQAQLLVDHRQDELRRQYVLDHSPNTFMAKTARGLTDFAVSALDPLNIAAAFVPGLGETRAGLIAARYGKTFGRLAEGATAGATGMAALQPLQYAEAKAYEDHYGPMDAFLNVAFGAALGGGLHAGFGKISDFFDRAHPETQEAALRSSVGQMVEGRPVDVEPVLATDPSMAPVSPAISSALEDIRISRSPLPNEPTLFETIRSLGGIKVRNEDGSPTTGGPELRQILDTNHSLENNKTGRPPDMMREALTERGWFGGNTDTSASDLADLHDLIEREARGNPVYHPDSSIHDELAYRELVDREMADAGIGAHHSNREAARMLAEHRARQADELAAQYENDLARHHGALSEEAQQALHSYGYEPGADYGAEFENEGQYRGPGQTAGGQDALATGPGGGNQVTRGAQGAPEVPPGVHQSIGRARQNSIDFARGREPSTIAPPAETLAHADAIVRAGDDPKTELADAEDQLKGYAEQGILSDAELAALKDANAADAEALDTRSKAAEVAARCLYLHP